MKSKNVYFKNKKKTYKRVSKIIDCEYFININNATPKTFLNEFKYGINIRKLLTK